MAAFVYIASPDNLDNAIEGTPDILFEESAEYWFLYRYFESANLDPRNELVDLYGGATISDYQMERLLAELENAEHDAKTRDSEWPVLVGWDGTREQSTERWENASREKVLRQIDTLRTMISIARKGSYVIVSSGD